MVGFDKPSMRSGSFIMELTQELVKSLFDYHEDGYLIWKVKPSQSENAGDRAGYLAKYPKGNRYKVKIKNKSKFVSRIIFLWHKNQLPKIVDHKDRNKMNDKIENLRAATESQNMRNRKSMTNSSSKYLGVYYHKKNKCWCAGININGKNKHLGSFETEDLAALAFNKEALLHCGEFANLNVIQTS